MDIQLEIYDKTRAKNGASRDAWYAVIARNVELRVLHSVRNSVKYDSAIAEFENDIYNIQLRWMSKQH
jgi:hypothetical protein